MRPSSFCLLIVSLLSTSATALDVNVSPTGSDHGSGNQSEPFATLGCGLKTLREHRDGSATLWLEDGVYPMDQTLSLDAKDENITIRAVHEGKAVLDAGLHVAPEALVMSEDARLDKAARGKVVVVDLKRLGVKHAKAFPDRFNDGGGVVQLFADDAWQPLSRWPNEHNTVMKKVLDRGDDPGAPGKRPGTFVFPEDRPARWKAAAEAGQLWLAGFWRVAWDWQCVRVKSMDLEKKSITLAAPVGGGIGSKYAGPEGAGTEPWRAINLVEEIDMPGEWAVDFAKQTLFWWPPTGGNALRRVVLADMDGPVVRMKGARHITLQGLVITGTLGNAVEITDGEGCAVVDCEIKCAGKNAVVIKGGKSHRVQSCDLHRLGHGGILLGGGARETLTPCGHVADNNHIHHYALAKKIWSPGIACGANDAGYACGCVVTHNLIHDSPHAAITYGGNDHRIEFNEIHDFLIESDDLGGLYTNNGWCSYGNVLRHNFIHHTSHALGIYLDDGDSGDTLEGNVMYRMGTGAAIGGGHDNILRNNLAIDCPGGFGIDARGVGRKYDQDSGMLRDYQKLQPVNPPWSTRFPTLPGLLQNNPGLPNGCVLERNVVIGTDKKAELRGKPEHFKVVTLKDNAALTMEDMAFADAGKMDFRSAPNAPVFKKAPGFEPIPFERIGLYVDAYRQKLPPHESGHTTSEWHRDRSRDK
jgi:hypothetical protein